MITGSFGIRAAAIAPMLAYSAIRPTRILWDIIEQYDSEVPDHGKGLAVNSLCTRTSLLLEGPFNVKASR